MSTATTRLPDLLRLARQRQGLSRTFVCARAGIPLSVLASWEEGRVTPNETQAGLIAKGLGCNVRSVVEEIRRATK